MILSATGGGNVWRESRETTLVSNLRGVAIVSFFAWFFEAGGFQTKWGLFSPGPTHGGGGGTPGPLGGGDKPRGGGGRGGGARPKRGWGGDHMFQRGGGGGPPQGENTRGSGPEKKRFKPAPPLVLRFVGHTQRISKNWGGPESEIVAGGEGAGAGGPRIKNPGGRRRAVRGPGFVLFRLGGVNSQELSHPRPQGPLLGVRFGRGGEKKRDVSGPFCGREGVGGDRGLDCPPGAVFFFDKKE